MRPRHLAILPFQELPTDTWEPVDNFLTAVNSCPELAIELPSTPVYVQQLKFRDLRGLDTLHDEHAPFAPFST